MDARSKLIDIAAFMDRVERAGQTDDFRYVAFQEALACLSKESRAESILNAFSDMSEEPLAEATLGPALGAYKKA
ncbi:MAG: hypothetical protein AAFX93_01335 [Verrucomicrobiota bacterium]